ncbi:MAG: hypothetical protein H6996_05620 [Moraxellaceae bacterium]|nr:hypothetical protein [Pseudomonadales bacterium]MCP5174573.1 hypothetical protein [Moraxellaceae bacterium]MCP5177149.1 hypothetical protein [Moraxellaceae bacterium]HQV22489.1 hypothetical protein [Agitococcus sp.]
MYKKLVLLTLLCTFLLPTQVIYADSNDLDEFRSKLTNEWLLVKNDRLRNIKTYARLEDGKRYRSFKLEATLETSVESLARVLLDFENYTRWFWKTRESKLIRQNSPTEYMVYMVHDAPYGLPDRDTVIKGIIEPQAKNKPYVTLRVTATPDALPAKPPLVRMIAEEMTIKFTPVGVNQVEMTTEGYFDPGGVVPAWAANFVQRNAPYAVIVALQRMAQRPEYNNKSKQPLPFPIYDYNNLP